MVWLFVAMLATAVMWFAWGVVFVGVGSLVSRLCRQQLATWEDVLISFWVGLAMTLGLLQIWHLILPIDARAGIAITILGAMGCTLHIRQIAALIRRRPRLTPSLAILGVLWIVFMIWLANRAINLPLDSDSGYYHLSLIEWQQRFAIVPGLANVMEPFIYNNTSFLYATMLDNGLWRYHGYHFVASLPMVALSLLVLLYVRRWLRETTFSYEYALAPLLAGLLVMLTASVSISSPSSDYIVFFFAIVVFFQYIIHLQEPLQTPTAHYRIFVICLLCVASLTIKFSLAVFFALVALCTVGRWLWLMRQNKIPLSRRLLVSILISGLFLGIPWIIRSFIISGYAAYPFTAVWLPVDWRVPNDNVAHITYSIRVVGFDNVLPESTFAVWTWLPRWWHSQGNDLFFVRIPLLWMVGLFVVALGLRLRGLWAWPRLAVWWLTPIIPALLLWFFSAPQVKYASVLIWLLVTALTLVVLMGARLSLRLKRLSLVVAAILFAAYPLFLVIRARVVLTQPGESSGFYGVIHFDLPYDAFVTRSGLTIWTGPQCYYNALPCSPWHDERLTLRVPGDMSQGFRINSE